jgi:hypothetical protein
VANTGVLGSSGSWNATPASWPQAAWRSLLLAFAISLFAHVIVLSTLPARREGDARPPVLTVTLRGVIAASPPPARDAVRAAPAPLPPVQRRPAPSASGRQGAERANPQVSGTTTEANGEAVHSAGVPERTPPAVQERTAPELQQAHRERAFEAAETRDAPPTPLSRPDLGEIGRKVAGRRIQSSVWIAADGSVEKAFVKRNEISDEVAGLLEQALASVRFTPAIEDGKRVPFLLQARLCFDDAGVLDTAPPECLRPGAGAEPEATAAPAR